MNKKPSTDKQPKPFRTLDERALRQVAGGALITATTIPKLDGGSKEAP